MTPQKPEPDDEDQKRHEKGKAAVLADAIRKEPDAAHADRRTNAGEDESETALKTVAGFGMFVWTRIVPPILFLPYFYATLGAHI